MTPGRLFRELQRRHVLRVVGAYAVAAWVAVEVFTTIQPILLEEQDWTNRFVVILALSGFPVVAVLSWIFDITPAGVRRTEPLEEAVAAAAAEPMPRGPQRLRLSARSSGFFGLGMLVALVGLAAYAGLHDYRAAPTADAPIESIAVLPFVDMSAAHDQEFFSDGVTEELLNRLAQVGGLRVAARTSSFAFKGRSSDVREIGRRLGVRAVLEGSVRREGDEIRISTKLIDAATGYQLWADSFEGPASDVFALQDEVANGVVDALRHRFVAAPEAGERGTASLAAYDHYLLGAKRMQGHGEEDLRQALVHFHAALAADSGFALAYAGAAQAWALLPRHGTLPVDSAMEEGSAAAARAIAIDPSLADAYAAMGRIVQDLEWDPGAAASYYTRALSYQPGNVVARQGYAETLMLLGRFDEAAVHVAAVLAADPLAPGSLQVDASLKLLTGAVAESLAAWRELVRLHPQHEPGLRQHIYAAIAAQRPEEAARSLDRLAALDAERAALYRAAAAALREPAPAAAAAVRESLARAADVPLADRAALYVAIGDPAAALDELVRAWHAHDVAGLPSLVAHPLFAAVRSAPRFRSMAGEIGVAVRDAH